MRRSGVAKRKARRLAEWKNVLYRTPSGESPALTWLLRLPKARREQLLA